MELPWIEGGIEADCGLELRLCLDDTFLLGVQLPEEIVWECGVRIHPNSRARFGFG